MKNVNVTIEDELSNRKPKDVTWYEIIRLGIEATEKKAGKK